MQTKNIILNLPRHILYHIFEYLGFQDLISLRQVSFALNKSFQSHYSIQHYTACGQQLDLQTQSKVNGVMLLVHVEASGYANVEIQNYLMKLFTAKVDVWLNDADNRPVSQQSFQYLYRKDVSKSVRKKLVINDRALLDSVARVQVAALQFKHKVVAVEALVLCT